MYWPMCSALIDEENRWPSRSTASTSAKRAMPNSAPPKPAIAASDR